MCSKAICRQSTSRLLMVEVVSWLSMLHLNGAIERRRLSSGHHTRSEAAAACSRPGELVQQPQRLCGLADRQRIVSRAGAVGARGETILTDISDEFSQPGVEGRGARQEGT